jgi:hypothetical protein
MNPTVETLQGPPKGFAKPAFIHNLQTWVDLAWAKPSCKHCHGTGVFGFRHLDPKGERKEAILCSCIDKARRARKASEQSPSP